MTLLSSLPISYFKKVVFYWDHLRENLETLYSILQLSVYKVNHKWITPHRGVFTTQSTVNPLMPDGNKKVAHKVCMAFLLPLGIKRLTALSRHLLVQSQQWKSEQ